MTRRDRENRRLNAQMGEKLAEQGEVRVVPNFALIPGQDISSVAGTLAYAGPGTSEVLRIRCGICRHVWAGARRLPTGEILLRAGVGLAFLGQHPEHRYKLTHCETTDLIREHEMTDRIDTAGDKIAQVYAPRGRQRLA